MSISKRAVTIILFLATSCIHYQKITLPTITLQVIEPTPKKQVSQIVKESLIEGLSKPPWIQPIKEGSDVQPDYIISFTILSELRPGILEDNSRVIASVRVISQDILLRSRIYDMKGKDLITTARHLGQKASKELIEQLKFIIQESQKRPSSHHFDSGSGQPHQ